MQSLAQPPLFCPRCGCAHRREEGSCARCATLLPVRRTEIIPIPRSPRGLGGTPDSGRPQRSRTGVRPVLICCAGLVLLFLVSEMVINLKDNAKSSSAPAVPVTSSIATQYHGPAPAATNPVIAISPAEPFKKSPDGAIIIAADLLYQLYDQNEDQADAQFRGKIIEVSGIVDYLGKYLLGKRYVTLRSREKGNLSVRCFFGDEHQDALAGLSPGRAVTIRGRCSGKAGNVILEDCALR